MAIWLPTWPTDLYRRRERASPERQHDSRPLLLIRRDQQRQIVAYGCKQASIAGVVPGMPAAQARALFEAGHVRLEPADPEGDAQRLRRLAVWAHRFSPLVQTDPPDGLLLDITGCARAFGSEERLAARAADSLSRLGIARRLVIAPTFASAWALARHGEKEVHVVATEPIRGLLSPLPIAALGADSNTVGSLAEIGIERIEHILDLPRSCLPSRFGVDLLHRLDQALGRALETIEPLQPTVPIEAWRTFEGPTAQPEAIGLAVRELLADISKQLQQRERGARQIEIVLKRSDLSPESIAIRLSRPSRDALHLERLAIPRLERAHLGFGVEALTIHVHQHAPIAHEQSLPNGTSQSYESVALGEFVDALTNRLGNGAVKTPRLRASHRPERAAELVSGSGSTLTTTTDIAAADRPSVLFQHPEPAEVTALSPDGPIRRVRWRHRLHDITACIGPERIGDEWWTGPGATRDYFRAQTDTGRWLWLARALETNRWFVHGVWA